ncbi:hypothetical protein [Marinovum sp.]|uniref:hypothetical protein n=1 Tax=Marinovum sp. TaxID=2024839 RepID=UPI002B27414E|nr:hypothetical protein [Marinovum sp.]
MSLTILPHSAHALENAPGTAGLCQATLRGEIVAGDAEALASLALEPPADWTADDDGRWKTFCLDSPGGDFAESMKIAAHLLENRIGTVVDEGATCSGSCGFVFLFGTAAQGTAPGLTHRRLHVGGTLGFAAPDLGSETTADDLLGFYALAAQPRPDTPRPYVDADLIEAVRGGAQLEVDTVNKAGRWDIALTGFDAPALSDRGFFHACQSLTAWPSRLAESQVSFGRNGADYELSVSSWIAGGTVRDRYELQFASDDLHECAATVAAAGDGTPLPLICGIDGETYTSVGPDDCGDPDLMYLWAPIPAAAMFPAGTSLEALADGRALPEDASEAVLTRPTPCRSESGTAEVINVNNYTSLRAEPTVDSEKLGELPLGETFEIGKSPAADTDHPDHAECAALCRAANADRVFDRAALANCVDTNWMWWKITGPAGETGFASAKFLDF